jgi:uncharacterized OsmC-like protein
MKLKTVATLRAKAECPSHARANIKIRDLECIIDEPIERGGTNEGTTPTEAAIAALVGCTNVIGHKCAKSLGIDLGHLDIEASGQLDRRGVTLAEEIETPFVSISLKVLARGSTTQEELTQIGAEVEKFCPLSKVFKNAGTEVKIEWKVVN